MKKLLCAILAAALVLSACADKEEKSFDSLASFEGTTIATMTGTTLEQLVASVIPNIQYRNYNTFSDMAAAVLSGKADAMVVDGPVATLLVAQNPELVVFPEIVTHDRYGFAVSKGSALTAPATAALESLLEQNVQEQLAARWFSADASQKILPTLTHKPDFDGSAGTIRYGFDAEAEPMSYIGGKEQALAPLGYDLEMISRIAYEMNMNVEFISINFDGLLVALSTGKVDMAGGSVSMTEERQQQVDFVGPYYEGGVTLVIRKERLQS